LLFGFSFSSGNILYSPESIDVDDSRDKTQCAWLKWV
jgi:hypothetical protein